MKHKENKTPEWYWVYGLHDAQIISVTTKESGWNPKDNCLILKLNCDGVVGDANIVEIRFFNFKILTNGLDINLLNGGWWLSDDLSEIDNRYLLELKFDTAKCNTQQLKLRFMRAEVIRA
ncbi:MAG: DUF4085 family protein [Oscillospiraceae bacterium]|nr:DUF4085 family protein [Oscillospiraceae bacterium]